VSGTLRRFRLGFELPEVLVAGEGDGEETRWLGSHLGSDCWFASGLGIVDDRLGSALRSIVGVSCGIGAMATFGTEIPDRLGLSFKTMVRCGGSTEGCSTFSDWASCWSIEAASTVFF